MIIKMTSAIGNYKGTWLSKQKLLKVAHFTPDGHKIGENSI